MGKVRAIDPVMELVPNDQLAIRKPPQVDHDAPELIDAYRRFMQGARQIVVRAYPTERWVRLDTMGRRTYLSPAAACLSARLLYEQAFATIGVPTRRTWLIRFALWILQRQGDRLTIL